jgi:hypothetical protein
MGGEPPAPPVGGELNESGLGADVPLRTVGTVVSGAVATGPAGKPENAPGDHPPTQPGPAPNGAPSGPASVIGPVSPGSPVYRPASGAADGIGGAAASTSDGRGSARLARGTSSPPIASRTRCSRIGRGAHSTGTRRIATGADFGAGVAPAALGAPAGRCAVAGRGRLTGPDFGPAAGATSAPIRSKDFLAGACARFGALARSAPTRTTGFAGCTAGGAGLRAAGLRFGSTGTSMKHSSSAAAAGNATAASAAARQAPGRAAKRRVRRVMMSAGCPRRRLSAPPPGATGTTAHATRRGDPSNVECGVVPPCTAARGCAASALPDRLP